MLTPPPLSPSPNHAPEPGHDGLHIVQSQIFTLNRVAVLSATRGCWSIRSTRSQRSTEAVFALLGTPTLLRGCSDVSSRWDQQRLQSAQCNLPCWLRLPQRVSPKKNPKPPDGSGESALCDVTLPISFPGEGPRPQPGVGPAPFETLFILCPQRFFGAGGGEAVLLFTSKPSPSSSFFQRRHLFVSLGIPVHYSEVPQLLHDSASYFL